MSSAPIVTRWRGIEPYSESFHAMRQFTNRRTAETPDELWLVEHPPVYTLGQAGNPVHLLAPDTGIPLVQTDRGGQITFHGPGQVIAYLLINLQRRQLRVREFVAYIEQAVMDTLAVYGIQGERQPGSPGIYVRGQKSLASLSTPPSTQQPFQLQRAKIAALGLKIRHGCSYHGVSLNVQMDLQPFYDINPCGYPGLKTVDMAMLGVVADWYNVADTLAHYLIKHIQHITQMREARTHTPLLDRGGLVLGGLTKK